MMLYSQNICGKYNDRKTLPSNHLKSFVNFIIMKSDIATTFIKLRNIVQKILLSGSTTVN